MTDSPTVIKWIPVEERLPEMTQIVIAFSDSLKAVPCWYRSPEEYYASGFRSLTLNVEFERISHWMPLPDPPGE